MTIKEKVIEKLTYEYMRDFVEHELVNMTIDLTLEEVLAKLEHFRRRVIFNRKQERAFEILLEDLGLSDEFERKNKK